MVQFNGLFIKASLVAAVAAGLFDLGSCQNPWEGPVSSAILEKQKVDLKEAKIVPDFLPEFEPTSFIKVSYDEKPTVNAGDIVRPHEAVKQPHIWFPAPDQDAQYTVVMFDADAMVPLVRHWVVGNIEGAKPGSGARDNVPYTPYSGPTPPINTNKHRYVFALYKQQQPNQQFTPTIEGDPSSHRAFWDINRFAAENNLTLIAATYMLAEHEDGYEGRASFHNNHTLPVTASTAV
ncbi:phosphatidylethanolamine-binding protein [Dichotomocladium elegans]|nr:phosphatidylethanolamine-binding protein [Dichotomocladium elegans]